MLATIFKGDNVKGYFSLILRYKNKKTRVFLLKLNCVGVFDILRGFEEYGILSGLKQLRYL